MPEFEVITDGRSATPGTFTVLGPDGRPIGPPRVCHDIYMVRAEDPFFHMAEALRTVPTKLDPITVTLKNFEPGSWARLYELFTGKRWRPSKAQRREAKRKKLRQRWAARQLPHLPGRAWHVDMYLYDWSIAETARGAKTRPHPRTGYIHITKGDNQNEH